MKTKKCSKCGVEKELWEYAPQKEGKYGLRANCRECSRIYGKIYRDNNPEKVKASVKKSKEKNAEVYRIKDREKSRKYRQLHPEISRDYYKRNSSKIKARSKEWQEANPEKAKASKQEWTTRNRSRCREYAAKFRGLYPQKVLAWNEQWRKNNPNYNKEWYQCNKETQNIAQRARRERLTDSVVRQDLKKLEYPPELYNDLIFIDCYRANIKLKRAIKANK